MLQISLQIQLTLIPLLCKMLNMEKNEAMKLATMLAYTAKRKGEVPVGAVIVKNNIVVAKAYNLREHHQIATHHAEILAIEKACKKLKSWRLDDCDIYVTLEPCPMCAGAIMNARFKNLFYAVTDEQSGGLTKFNLQTCLNHSVNIEKFEEFEKENKNLIQSFFKEKRKKAK